MKWSDLLERMNKVRPIAFYLPQYHHTPENDYYWGKASLNGPTSQRHARPMEVTTSPIFQPISDFTICGKQTLERQAALARRYGIAGFCVYYYNFGRRRALEQAFEAMLADPTIDFPFCICWANENSDPSLGRRNQGVDFRTKIRSRDYTEGDR